MDVIPTPAALLKRCAKRKSCHAREGGHPHFNEKIGLENVFSYQNCRQIVDFRLRGNDKLGPELIAKGWQG